MLCHVFCAIDELIFQRTGGQLLGASEWYIFTHALRQLYRVEISMMEYYTLMVLRFEVLPYKFVMLQMVELLLELKFLFDLMRSLYSQLHLIWQYLVALLLMEPIEYAVHVVWALPK